MSILLRLPSPLRLYIIVHTFALPRIPERIVRLNLRLKLPLLSIIGIMVDNRPVALPLFLLRGRTPGLGKPLTQLVIPPLM